MKQHVAITIDSQLLMKIDRVRGLSKRSTFMEHLLRIGLEQYMEQPATYALQPERKETRAYRSHAGDIYVPDNAEKLLRALRRKQHGRS